MSILQKIADIEAEMAKTQKNKATNFHLGLLKAKLSKLKAQLIEGGGKGGGEGEGFDVSKTGDARIGLVGFPSVGKSTLLNKLTGTFSEVASYEFTTLTCVPGIFKYKGAKMQLLDLPGIIEGAHNIPISAHLEWNLDGLLEAIWNYLDLVRIYTKPKGHIPDYDSRIHILMN